MRAGDPQIGCLVREITGGHGLEGWSPLTRLKIKNTVTEEQVGIESPGVTTGK